jgi:hypothetical protein
VNTDRESLFLVALMVGALSLAMAWSIATARAQEQPSIVITAPVEGEVLPGPDLTVQVAVSGFNLRAPLQETREPNAGHIEYLLDTPPTFDQPMPLGEDNIIPSGRFSETFASVPPGEHTVYVCLAYDDHTCIDPALTDSARVTVGQSPPTPEPTLTPEATPEPPSPTPELPSPTPEPPPPTPPPATPTPTQEPVLDGMTEETPCATISPTPSPTPRPTPPGPEPTSTPMAGLAPSTLVDSSNARSVDWALALACVSVVGLVAVGWLTLLAARRPSRTP